MLVDDLIQLLDVQPCIPGALGIDDTDRTLLTDPEAVHLASEDAAVSWLGWYRLCLRLARPWRGSRGQARCFETVLQMGPQGICLLARRTSRRGLTGAEED